MKLVLLSLILFLSSTLFAQKWVADTLMVSFGSNDTVSYGAFRLQGAADRRPDPPRFLSVYEKKKWLVFPVDQIVTLERPLSTCFDQKFQSGGTHPVTYIPTICSFYATNAQKGKKRTFTLNTTVELLELTTNGDTTLVGTLYNSRTITQPKKDSIPKGYELLIEDWNKHFSSDVQAVQLGLGSNLYYFRAGQQAVSKNFYTSADFFYGINFWGVDGELWFSDPEASQKFKRSTRIIRYQNHSDFQSIAVGKNIKQINYRINDKWLFLNKTAFLLGLNNWKDIKTVNHTYEEVFLLDLSATQKVCYNPLDKKGLTAGLGVMEDVHYIVYHPLKFNVAIVLNLAMKL